MNTGTNTYIPGIFATSTANLLRETAAVHGVRFAAQWAKKRGINISVVRFALFGRY